MNYFRVIFVSLFSFISFSQTDMKLWVGLSKGQEFRNLTITSGASISSEDQSLNCYQLNVGVLLFNRFNVSADVGFRNIPNRVYGTIYKNSISGNFKSFTLGLDLDYRIFKKAIVSPKINLSGGFFPYSNLKNKQVDPFSLRLSDDTHYYFKSWKGYSNLNIFLSLKLADLYLDIGGGVNMLGYSLVYKSYVIEDINCFSMGWNWKFKLSYAFPVNRKVDY